MAWTQDRAWRPWAGRTHKATLPGDAAGPEGAARDGGAGGVRMGSRMTPCCPESGSAWVRVGTVLDCLHRSWRFPQAGKGVCGWSVTRTMPTTVSGSVPERVPRRSFHQHSLLVPPTSFTDPVRRHSEVKLQAQVKSNPGSWGKRPPEPSVPATGSEQEAKATPQPPGSPIHRAACLPVGRSTVSVSRNMSRGMPSLCGAAGLLLEGERGLSRRWTSSRERGPCGHQEARGAPTDLPVAILPGTWAHTWQSMWTGACP